MIHPALFGTRTLIFDMDGTLISSGKMAVISLRKALDEFFEERSVPAPDYTDSELESGLGAPSNEFYKSLLPPEFVNDWIEFRNLVFENEENNLATMKIRFPGTIRVLTELKRRGYKLALVSNCNFDYLDAIVKSQNLEEFFEKLCCLSAYEGATKTSLIGDVLNEIGSSLSESCAPAVMIGDRHYDIDAAINNEIPSVGALYGYGSREELDKSDTWISDIRQLLHLFNPLQELAEIIATEINRRRKNDRPVVVSIGGKHSSVTAQLVPYILSSLTDLNVVVNHMILDNHTNFSSTSNFGNDNYGENLEQLLPWDVLSMDIFNRKDKSVISTALKKINTTEEKSYRNRAGEVLLIESPFILGNDTKELLDYSCWIDSSDSLMQRASKKLETKTIESSDQFSQSPIDKYFLKYQNGVIPLLDVSYLKVLKNYMKRENPAALADITVKGNRIKRGIFKT